jgi:hypothetical protein
MRDGLTYTLAILIAGAFLWVGFRLLRARFRQWVLMRKYGDPEIVETMMGGQISRGMTIEMVIDVWGTPADMDEVVMKTKTKRELKYDQKGKNRFGTRVYFENGECVGWETK